MIGAYRARSGTVKMKDAKYLNNFWESGKEKFESS